MSWREYQNNTAAFFRGLGLDAEVEAKVEGVRGLHEIDVFVQGSFHGISFKWAVECKDWKTSIPKEKVLALSAIVQDIGADRGFLMSEAGFQSGAIRATNNTNITLTSLEDISLETEGYLLDATIGDLNWRASKALKRLRKIKKEHFDDDYFPPMSGLMGDLFILDFVLDDALKNEYPIVFMKEDRIDTLDELIQRANSIIEEANDWEPSNG
ncbi:MAG: restriction endonuclease [Candidatus Thiodiazotropha endolucinida]|nr:restriction endonuclease [Candidatus Thiodiazotropha taylori]MCW4319672.1 restriction endonuclease [Candidatus Thiodiazotropha taylori]